MFCFVCYLIVISTTVIDCLRLFISEVTCYMSSGMLNRSNKLNWLSCVTAAQFLRDVEDEKMWINERLTRAKIPNYGNSLLSVQMLLGKNRTLRNEVDSHEPAVISVVDLGLSMIEEGHPQSDEFQQQINELNTLWADLQNAVDQQKARIEMSEVAQQVFYTTDL